MVMQEYKKQLDDAFASDDYRSAHNKARPVLERMAADNQVLSSIVDANFANPRFLQSRRINPVLALPIAETSRYTLVANCWIPRPDGDVELSHQSIHHHGNLLLSTVCGFGEGYESILFKKVSRHAGEFRALAAEKMYRNPRGHYEFVDTFTPHVVFYPKGVSVTYALWSRESPTLVKKIAVPQAIKKPLRSLALNLGLGGALGLNQAADLDYCVRDSKIVGLSSRVQYTPGSNENFLQALHFFLRSIAYGNASNLEILARAQRIAVWQNEFERHHLFIPDVNLRRQEILACLS